MRVSKVDVIVLGFLADRSMHGYDLLEAFSARSMGFWTEVGKASVYQALRRLDAAGLITGRSQEGTEGPDRRVYRINRAGRERLRAGLAERFGLLAPYETEAGVALGFAHLTTARTPSALGEREGAVRGFLANLDEERARTRADSGVTRTLSDLMLDRQEALAKAELAWIRSARSAFARLRR
jgi:DNA-binding PadR family transcriptional regulator